MTFLRFPRTLLIALLALSLSSHAFSSQVSTLLQNNICLNAPFSPITSPKTNSLKNYDCIVVGSRPVGRLLSARLAIAGFKVLLLEAGDDQGWDSSWAAGKIEISMPAQLERDSAERLYHVPLTMDDYWRNCARKFVLNVVNAKNADGTQVHFHTSVTPPKAIGIDFVSGSSLYSADSRASSALQGAAGSFTTSREVIISAGSFNTPQLLKLSGIRPAAELAHHNITLIAELPGLGTNLQDRYEASLGGQAPSDFSLTKGCTLLHSSPDPCYED